MFSMRFSDGVTVKTRKALKPHWRCVQVFFPELIVAEQFSAEARFADELPRLDVHGAAIEFEREIEARAVFEGEAKHTIGNDADGERIARRFERDARMEGRIVVARLFGEIGKEIVMIDQRRRAVGAAGEFEGDHGLGRLDRVREKLRGGARVLGRPVELLFERNAGFGEHMGAGAAEAVDERPVAEIEGVGELRHLRGRPVEIAVMEEQLQAAQDLLRRAADKANDQGRGEKAKTRDGVQDREITRASVERAAASQRGESAGGEERSDVKVSRA